MYDFTYLRPRTVAEAVEALRTGFDPKLMAGGMTLLPTMKARLASPATLIDLADIGELRGISVRDNRLEIGAMTRHYDVASDGTVRARIPALADLAGGIADRQVRYRGTMGGSLSNSDPSADYPAAALALDARMITSQKTEAAGDFLLGTFATSLEEDEVLCRISFAIPEAAAYEKIPNPASGYAMTGVFVARLAEGHRVGVTGAASEFFRHRDLETALDGGADHAAALDVPAPDREYLADMHGDARYRRNLVRVAAARAIQKMQS